jgi:hypothetical protein
MPKYALECTGVRYKNSRIPSIGLGTKFDWSYRVETFFGCIISARLHELHKNKGLTRVLLKVKQ